MSAFVTMVLNEKLKARQRALGQAPQPDGMNRAAFWVAIGCALVWLTAAVGEFLVGGFFPFAVPCVLFAIVCAVLAGWARRA